MAPLSVPIRLADRGPLRSVQAVESYEGVTGGVAAPEPPEYLRGVNGAARGQVRVAEPAVGGPVIGGATESRYRWRCPRPGTCRGT